MSSLAFRRAQEQDMRFVVRSWVDSYRTAYAAGLIQMRTWREVMEPQVQAVLDRPGCRVWVAYAPDEDDDRADLYGWCAAEPEHDQPLLHYVFIKHAYRKMGIARGLLRKAGIDPERPFTYTCKTAAAARLRHKIPGGRWNPLPARFDPKK